jgi:hypothetical protein
MRPVTDVREISSIGYGFMASKALFAESAKISAQTAAVGSYSPVPYFLYCRSLELVLKAYLLARGVSKGNLNKFGHDLLKLVEEARPGYEGGAGRSLPA